MIQFDYLNPIKGERLDVKETPDEVFSQQLLGPGFVYLPDEGRVVSPIDGEVTMIFPTGHAIAIRHKKGFEVMIHIGLDSVNLKGKGFHHHTAVGQKVKMGDHLLDFDLELLKKEAMIATPVVFVQRQSINQIQQNNKTNIETYELV
jgi:glucose-specific phosphotransferase system IIA component